MSVIKSYFLLIIAVLSFNLSFAIVTRHDVADEAYQELGQQYPSFVSLSNGCGGTLIASHWVITAAHCTTAIASTLFNPEEVVLMGQRIKVTELIQHTQADIALLRLSEEVRDVKPIPLYQNFDEAGQVAVLVGRGGTGNGLKGVIHIDDKLRGARNKIEWTNEQVIAFEMDDPATALDLEGVGGPGDSGGPAYLETDEGIFLAGVSSYGAWFYGDFDHYVRVSKYVDWITATMTEADLKAANPEKCPGFNTNVLDETLLTTYSGVYKISASSREFTLSSENGKLYYETLGSPKEELYAVSACLFIHRNNFTELIFEFRNDQTVSLTLQRFDHSFSTEKLR